jgi:hypothetical protein
MESGKQRRNKEERKWKCREKARKREVDHERSKE